MAVHDNAGFATTRWSLVRAAAGNDESLSDEACRAALAELCRCYWFPVYSHCRRRGSSAEEAEDYTQEFFSRVLDGRLFDTADPQRGRFRTYLLTSLDHFLSNEHRREQAQKRGGGVRHVPIDVAEAESRISAMKSADQRSAEAEFERQWALIMLEKVFQTLQAEHQRDERRDSFDLLRQYLAGSTTVPYAAVAEQLGMSEGAVKVAVHRLRKRFGQLLRAEISETVASPDEIDDEIKRLQTALSN